MRQRFDIADIIIKTEMVIKCKIEKNKNTNLNPQSGLNNGLRTDLVIARRRNRCRCRVC